MTSVRCGRNCPQPVGSARRSAGSAPGATPVGPSRSVAPVGRSSWSARPGAAVRVRKPVELCLSVMRQLPYALSVFTRTTGGTARTPCSSSRNRSSTGCSRFAGGGSAASARPRRAGRSTGGTSCGPRGAKRCTSRRVPAVSSWRTSAVLTAIAQGGDSNSAGMRVSQQKLVEALKEDARSAEPEEAVRAREYAEDLEEAVRTESPARAGRILARINILLSSVSSAFSLTRDLLPPGS